MVRLVRLSGQGRRRAAALGAIISLVVVGPVPVCVAQTAATRAADTASAAAETPGALLRLADVQQGSGELRLAYTSLVTAFGRATPDDGAGTAAILGSLGSVESTLSRLEPDRGKRAELLSSADRHFTEALRLASVVA